MIEIKLVPTANKSVPTLEKALNKLSADGWYFVGTIPVDVGSVVAMQRIVARKPDTNFYNTLNQLKETR